LRDDLSIAHHERIGGQRSILGFELHEGTRATHMPDRINGRKV